MSKHLNRHLASWGFLSIVLLAIFAPLQAFAKEDFQLKLPERQPVAKAQQPDQYEDDLLMISPNPDADKDDITEALKEANGTIVNTFGADGHIVYVVRTAKGKLAETEKKLGGDKNFHGLQRCGRSVFNAVSTQAAVNDPAYPQEWHLNALHAQGGWAYSQGAGVTLSVIDSGVNAASRDLSGKVYTGYNAVNYTTNTVDAVGHGTMVSTTAAAIANNNFGTASPAYKSYIYPISITIGGQYVSETATVNAIYYAGQRGVKIINISSGPTNGSYNDARRHPALHEALRWFYYQKGGLAFLSAGNESYGDATQMNPYMMLISSIDSTGRLSSFSNYGNSICFTAPGRDIFCLNNKDTLMIVAGTSFSSPLCASVAAMVWAANGRLKNTDVRDILIQSCQKPQGSTTARTIWYGYGLPNAEKAVSLARSR